MRRRRNICLAAACTLICLAVYFGRRGEKAGTSYELGQPIAMEALFPYSADYLNRLKTRYQLEKLVSETNSDFEAVQAVAAWVTGLWDHNGWNTPSKNDPLTILYEVTEKGEEFRCVEYGTVIGGCLNALGIPARNLNLKTEDVETRELGAGHVVNEVYLEDLRKWAFVDGQWGMIPTLDGVPLNGVEFAQALKEQETLGSRLDVICLLPEKGNREQYFRWIEEYLFYFDFGYWVKNGRGEAEGVTVMLVPQGAKKPEIFQVKYKMDVDFYIDSVEEFYPPVSR